MRLLVCMNSHQGDRATSQTAIAIDVLMYSLCKILACVRALPPPQPACYVTEQHGFRCPCSLPRAKTKLTGWSVYWMCNCFYVCPKPYVFSIEGYDAGQGCGVAYDRNFWIPQPEPPASARALKLIRNSKGMGKSRESASRWRFFAELESHMFQWKAIWRPPWKREARKHSLKRKLDQVKKPHLQQIFAWKKVIHTWGHCNSNLKQKSASRKFGVLLGGGRVRNWG